MSQVTTPDDRQGADIEPPAWQAQVGTQPATGETTMQGFLVPRPRDPWLALAVLVALGGVSGIAYYLGFVRPYLLSDYYARPLMDLAKINGYTGPAANSWAFTWIVLFACYYAAFRVCPPAEGVTRLFRRFALILICGWAVFFSINLLFMYPVGAADLFDQIFRARLTAQYGYNPFTTLPSSLAGDPFQPYVAWRGDPSPYGPVWESLAAAVSFLAGSNLWANLIEFKLLVMLAYGVSVGLTYGILRTVKPEWALRGTLLFAWNPLVLFEVAGNGHNDAVVVMFMLAAVFFLVRARRVAVLPMLVAGALTKFVPVLLVPIAVGALWRDRLRGGSGIRDQGSGVGDQGLEVGGEEQPARPEPRSLVPDPLFTLAVSAVLSVGLAMIFYAPFWTGPESIMPRNRGTLFTASIPKVILDTLVRDFGWSEGIAQWYVRNVAYGIVALVALGLAVWVWRTPNATTPEGRGILLRRTLIAFYEIIFAYLLVASLWFQPWYLLWLVALTAPVARMAYVHRTLLFCIGGVLNYFVWDFLWLWNRTDFRTIQITSAITVYTLPVLYTLYVWTVGRRTEDIGRSTTDEQGVKLRITNYELP
ncbi:MAG: hypothetical protein WCD37_05600 [Chloroflexia bacterium]